LPTRSNSLQKRRALLNLAARHGITEVPWEVYDRLWSKLCKRQKYGLLRDDYAKAKESDHDLRYPQDGRLVPGYAKDALAQLRTLTECALAMVGDKEKNAA